MSKQMIYTANWKMCLPFAQAVEIVKQNQAALARLAQQHKIIISPSATAINALHAILADTSVAIAGQNCSTKQRGAFTGQLAATDLASAGARYCIVGHSECRKHNQESSAVVAEKALRVMEANMTPIICIGETADQFKSAQTRNVLDSQLAPVLPLLTQDNALIIAYEPVWAIGTGILPTREILADCFMYLAQKLSGSQRKTKLLYGGSVTASNATALKQIPFLDGFLIGGASLDFQEFKKIVEC